MSTIPRTHEERIAFFEQRLADWAKNPAAIGLTAAQVAALQARTVEARAAQNALIAARAAAGNATLDRNLASDALFSLGGDLVRTIRAFAQASDDAIVYAEASIRPPKVPSPTGAPPPPTEVAFALLPGGALRISWKGSMARGTTFAVYRAPVGSRAYTLLDTVHAKHFVDRAIPPGTTSLAYAIEARRADHRVRSLDMVVHFGAADSPGRSAGTTPARAA